MSIYPEYYPRFTINETKWIFGKVARRQIVPRGVSGNGQATVSKLCHQFARQSPLRQRVIRETLTSSSMIETNLANCECDCRNILQLISWLTAGVVVLGLCSLTMLVITLYLFKKSRANPYNQNIELVPFGNKVLANQHKINSFTCLELQETTRILFYFYLHDSKINLAHVCCHFIEFW